MEPTLHAGDLVLVDTRARPAEGDVICARHPLDAQTQVIKRVAYIDGSHLFLRSDNPDAPGAADSNRFGLVELSSVIGVVTSVIRG